MSRPKTGLDAEKLFAKGPRGVDGDLRAFRPPPFAIGLDGLIGSTRVTREEVCSNRKQKIQS
jgi:hypothetical protein